MIKSAHSPCSSLRARAMSACCFPVLLALAGCSAPPADPQPPRPVRVAQVESAAVLPIAGFAGEVASRRDTVMAFRVGGKLEARLVDVGDRVRKGQAIARLDASDFRLATQSLKAQWAAAKAELAFSSADLARYRELLDQRVIAPPEFERHQTSFTAVKEKAAALEAQWAQTSNQLKYTNLTAERDGIITGFAVEAGDVVAAGQPVARLAQTAEKEVSFQVPEQRMTGVVSNREVEITLWALGERRFRGKIREVAPAADPITRTFRIKAVLLEGGEQALLGMTATVWLPSAQTTAVHIPRSAVFTTHDDPMHPKVWLVDAGSVHAVPVSLGRPLVGERIEVSGLAAGQVLVSAGVQRLLESEAVRVLGHSVEREQP